MSGNKSLENKFTNLLQKTAEGKEAINNILDFKNENFKLFESMIDFRMIIQDEIDFLNENHKNKSYENENFDNFIELRNKFDDSLFSLGQVLSVLTPTSKHIFSSLKENNLLEQYYKNINENKELSDISEGLGNFTVKCQAASTSKDFSADLSKQPNLITENLDRVEEAIQKITENPVFKDVIDKIKSKKGFSDFKNKLETLAKNINTLKSSTDVLHANLVYENQL